MNLLFVRPFVSRRTVPLMLAAFAVLSATAFACSASDERTPSPEATEPVSGVPAVTDAGTSQQVSLPSGIPAADIVRGSSEGIASSIAPSVSTQYYPNVQTTQQSGIWVTGTGTKEVASDVAEVYLGVESTEETVADARQKAADAMTAVLDAIRALGISDDDITTTSFNIYPQQVWVEVTDEDGRHGEPRITGYTVSNQVRVTVKNIDLLDEVIDSAAEEGGDLIRVNSVSFTVADPAAHGAETRQLAAADARAKAELYAEAMGVTLGDLIFLTELSSSAPFNQARAIGADYAEAGAFAPTPIEAGDVSLTTTIQAAFAIVP